MTTTSREYAEALFELAVQAGLTEETSEGLETVISAVMQTPEFGQLLASPAISREERMDTLSAAFQDKIPLSMLVLLRMMVFRGHARNLPRMIESYRELARERRGESEAKVFSAVELTETERIDSEHRGQKGICPINSRAIPKGVLVLPFSRFNHKEMDVTGQIAEYVIRRVAFSDSCCSAEKRVHRKAVAIYADGAFRFAAYIILC